MARKKVKEVPHFTVELHLNGETFTASADTLEEAILGLPPVQAKTRGTIVITKDGVTAQPIQFNIPMLKRLFYPGLTGVVQRAILGKRHALLS